MTRMGKDDVPYCPCCWEIMTNGWCYRCHPVKGAPECDKCRRIRK